ncbi:MAG: prolyl aminopeptidase [Pseudomonadota bacterium]
MAEPRLFPQTEPYKRFHLPVTGGHELYVELSGRSDGEPVVVLHGGPGAGTSPFLRRFFDPARYMAVLFDQRGAGRSRPRGALTDNTTWDLVADIERLREYLDVPKWQVFGGSWGSTLALLYAQAHPDRVSRLILRGIFTMTADELKWFYGGPAGKFFPEAWADFVAPIPEAERDDLIAAYYKRLTSDDDAEQTRFARPWVRWESACAALRPGTPGVIDGPYSRAFARIESHFFINNGWLSRDDQILSDLPKIAEIPAIIVQGRYDMICPPATAVKLAAAWPAADLKIIDDAGHALSEPGISDALLRAMLMPGDTPEPV